MRSLSPPAAADHFIVDDQPPDRRRQGGGCGPGAWAIFVVTAVAGSFASFSAPATPANRGQGPIMGTYRTGIRASGPCADAGDPDSKTGTPMSLGKGCWLSHGRRGRTLPAIPELMSGRVMREGRDGAQAVHASERRVGRAGAARAVVITVRTFHRAPGRVPVRRPTVFRVHQRGRVGRAGGRVIGPLPQALQRFTVTERDGGFQPYAGLHLGQIHHGINQARAAARSNMPGCRLQ
jgi:hypothetical protein